MLGRYRDHNSRVIINELKTGPMFHFYFTAPCCHLYSMMERFSPDGHGLFQEELPPTSTGYES